MKLIWATRGRTWGFRFLLDGGLKDPLPVYEEVFSFIEGELEGWYRLSDKMALRFPDPLDRRDHSGRIISQEFIVFSPLADEITSVEHAHQRVWPLVADEFARIWELPQSPRTKST